ncbi:MAG: DUF4129 domain-containing protein [Puniceicoccaceae bacterium]|nr:MAG: DUF4129 domain-containing protein [Puniceicoccaceae bacterium]
MSAAAHDPPPPPAPRAAAPRHHRHRQPGEPGTLDLVEEAVHLLRRTPARAWGLHLLGTAPFVLALLFYWMEMASSGLAARLLLPGALVLAVLFIVHRVTQVRFATELRAIQFGAPAPSWSAAAWRRVFGRQAFWPAAGTVALPVALLCVLPFMRVYSFFQYQKLADPADPADEADTARENWSLARHGAEQGWLLLALLLVVFALALANALVWLFLGPHLLKTLLGIETVYTRAGFHLFNSTSIFACLLLAWVVTEPLTRAVQVLRRHYAEARRSGADLELRLRWSLSGTAAAGVALLALLLALPPLLAGDEPPTPPTPPTATARTTIEPADLDQTIETVLVRREFIWRFPREEVIERAEPPAWLARIFDWIRDLWERFWHWLQRDQDRDPVRAWHGLPRMGEVIGYAVIGLFLAVLVILALRALKNRRSAIATEGNVDVTPAPAVRLEDDSLTADALPHHRWLDLAREQLALGNRRLALRAYFLAQLSCFSQDGLIRLHRARSNREYAREIARRAQDRPTLASTFEREVKLFDRIWYGAYPAGDEEVREMESLLRQTGVLS